MTLLSLVIRNFSENFVIFRINDIKNQITYPLEDRSLHGILAQGLGAIQAHGERTGGTTLGRVTNRIQTTSLCFIEHPLHRR